MAISLAEAGFAVGTGMVSIFLDDLIYAALELHHRRKHNRPFTTLELAHHRLNGEEK